MTPTELRAWRTTAGLSQGRLSALLGVDVMTISRWERGLREIPPYLHLALSALDQHNSAPDHFRESVNMDGH